MKRLSILLLAAVISLSAGPKPKYEIKFAALATKGSTWMNILEELDTALRDKTGGELGFTIYPGGVAGDENKVLRKIRIRQLHAAGLTGNGLGEILPEERILDSPFLFRSTEEVDYVTSRLFDRFAEGFEKKGFILLGWAEVGWVNVFTKDRVSSFEEMKSVRMWEWESDPVAKYTFSALGLSPVPLAISDVITSLQSGIIDGVYISPLAAVALQWYTRIDYMYEMPIANAMGAVVLDKRFFSKLPEEYQQILVTESKKYLGKITAASRRDNAKSIEVMKKNGVELVNPFTPEDVERFNKAGADARRAMVGKLYDAELLEAVEKMLEEFRAQQALKP